MKYEKFLKVRDINRQIIVPAFERADVRKVVNQIRECGDYSVMYECNCCHTREWKGFSRCKSKFCLCCNTVKSLSWLARTYDKFAQFLNEGKYITMLTLTIRDRASLREALDVLNTAWRFFYNRDRQSSKEFHWKFIGGIKSLEVKTGENSGEWHPHLHCLLIKDRYSYDKAFIDTAWRRCVRLAGGAKDEGITHIESIYATSENGKKTFDKLALMKGIVESVKYISKFDYKNESSERLRELVDSLDGVRQIDTFGCCKNIQKAVEDDSKDERIHDVVEHTCQLCGCSEATLVNMFTDDIPKQDKYTITGKVDIEEYFEGKKLDILKWRNGLQQYPEDEIQDKLEDLFYQASMFNDLGNK